MLASTLCTSICRIQTKIPLSSWRTILINQQNLLRPSPLLIVKQQVYECSTSAVENAAQNSQPEETFSSLMRNCKFTQMGDPVGRVVVGRIYHVVEDDLYIDFGHKFPCVCQRPRDSRDKYVRGTDVKLKIKSLELSQKFLGHDKELTLLEADCQLLGLYQQ